MTWLTQTSKTARSHSNKLCSSSLFREVTEALILISTSLSCHLSLSLSLSLSLCLSLSLQLTAARAQSAHGPALAEAAQRRTAVLTATVRVERIFLWWNTAASSQEQQVAQPRCKSKTHPCAKSYTERSARGVAAVWKCMSNTDSIDMWSAVARLSRRRESERRRDVSLSLLHS